MAYTRINGFLLLILINTVSGHRKTDYCTFHCPLPEHLACNNYGKAGPDCPRSVRLVNMLQFKNYIQTIHNIKRNDVAGGSGQLRPAARMATIQWNDDLADMATLKVLTCNKMQNLCINTAENKFAGQNVGIYRYTENEMQGIHALLHLHLMTWFNSGDNCSTHAMEHYTLDDRSCASLALTIRDHNTHVGCAASRYIIRDFHHFMLACHYKYNNFVNRPVYTSSHMSADGCMTGRNAEYPNLCSIHEVY